MHSQMFLFYQLGNEKRRKNGKFLFHFTVAWKSRALSLIIEKVLYLLFLSSIISDRWFEICQSLAAIYMRSYTWNCNMFQKSAYFFLCPILAWIFRDWIYSCHSVFFSRFCWFGRIISAVFLHRRDISRPNSFILSLYAEHRIFIIPKSTRI